MKVLIAVQTCARDRWRTPAHREMLCGHGADVRFFLGRGNENPEADEIVFDVGDDWENLPGKVRGALQWALDRGYEYIFKCDSDTFVDVPKLLASGFEQHQYCGLMGDEGAGKGIAHCPSGGVGWWLSARAAKAFLDHWPKYSAEHGGPYHQYEDWALAIVLNDHVERTGDTSLIPHHDIRYWNPALEWKFGKRELKDCITWHFWNGKPDWKPEDTNG
jgi:hypothetical protein